MGVIIENIVFTNAFTGVTTDYLLGNVGDKIQIETYLSAEEVFVSEAKENVDRILLAPQDFRVGVVDTTDVISTERANAFVNYRVGDKIGIFIANDIVDPAPLSGSISYYDVYEIISNNAVRVESVGGGAVDFHAANGKYDNALKINSKLFLATELTSLNFRWNMVGNTELDTFLNKIDGQLNQARLGNITASNQSMTFDSPVTNNYGTLVAKTNGSTDFAQKYVVTHNTIIQPFFLGGQKFDLEDGIAPSYYLSAECLKYIVSVDAGRNDNDPNFIQTVDFSANDGNTGWYDENFNGGNSNYSVIDTRYIRQDLSVINAIELTDNVQTIEIDVFSTDGTFSNNNTEFTLNFGILPGEKEDYTFNGKTVVENFYFDYAFNTVGSAFVAGDNNGTDEQIFTEVSAAFVDANNITITAVVDLETAAIADLTAKDFEYLLWVSTQDYLLDTEESDRVAIKTDIQPFYIDLTDDGMITQTTKFLRHYESDVVTEGTTTLIARVEDDVLGYTQFIIDRTARTTDEILINSISCELIAKKTDGTEFELESYTQDFGGTQIVGDTQYIDNSVERVFKMPDLDQRKTIKVNRRIDLDTVDLRYYEVYYPFLMRWEYWEALAGVDGDAFDTLEPLNGQNEQWHRYNTLVDWDIYYRFTVNSSKNGETQRYQTDTQITTFTYEEDTEWINEDIEAFDADTLVSNGTLIKAPTKIIATKEYSGATPPATAADVEWVLRIEVHEQGGIIDIRYLSSVYDWSQFSWFNSVDASNKVLKYKAGNVFTAEALIDFGSLPTNSSLKISARIYDETALIPITFCILQEDNEEILKENAVDCIQEEFI